MRVSTQMAVSAKTPTVASCHSELSNALHHYQMSKNINILVSSRSCKLSLKKKHEISVVSTDSIDTRDPNSVICDLCLRGNLEQALIQLNAMKKFRLLVEEETYITVIDLCERKRAKPAGCQVYVLIKSSTTHLSIRLGNALLSMFVRLGNLVEAWYVFGKMSERNIFSWNVLIGGYAKAGYFDEALNLYHRMLWAGLQPDVYTFPSVLRTCGAVPDLVRGREIHVHVLRFGFQSDTDVNNSLITMYVKCWDVYSARLVFDKMPLKDTISWNAMISGYFENGDCLEGLHLFLNMLNHFVIPDLKTMTSVISACEFISDERFTKSIQGYATKHEYGTDVSISNSLIQVYSSLGAWEEAEKIFTRIKSKDVVSWTSMISGYANNKLPEKAIKVYKKMQKDGIAPDEITLATVISACASLRLLDTGIELHEYAKKTKLISYVIVANAIIDLYSKCKLIDKGIEVFKQIPNKNVISWTSIILGFRINNRSLEALTFFRKMKTSLTPNSITLISILSACARVGSLMTGKELHAYALRTGLIFNESNYVPNAILDMYTKCGKMEHALNQFNSQFKDIVSWNTLLTGYAQRGQGQEAIDLFNKMDVNPDGVTFISLLCACARSGMVENGLEYFKIMTERYNLVPNVKHYACVVDLLGRSGNLEEAYMFIKKMPIKPDEGIWGALLNSCRIHKRVDLGEIAAKRILEMEESRNIGYYTLLCNFYSDIGKFEEVARVKKMMIEDDLDPGCSWVEVKGQIHAFLTGDKNYPQEKEITGILNGFYEKMEEVEGDLVSESKGDVLCGHSERLAIGFGLINTAPGMPIRVTKNLYMCRKCHDLVKFISKVVRREIVVRDTECFHLFKDGLCSCGDSGYKS